MRINNEKNLRRSGLRGLSFTGVYLEEPRYTHTIVFTASLWHYAQQTGNGTSSGGHHQKDG